ncbi:MAG: amidohydrolase family protein [Bacteroidales bacterium]
MEALRGMTIWAAKAAFEENQKGSIESGKVADFVILPDDIMKCDLSNIPGIEIEATYLFGQKVFELK